MAERHRTDANRGRGYERRTFLKLTGAVAATAATGLAAPAAAETSGYDPEEVVDLADEGIEDGDVIDDYLDEHFEDGVEVRVPAGTYDWEGSGFGDNATQNAGVVGDGDVVLEAVEAEYNDNVVAEGGELRIANLTVHGEVVDSRIRLETDEDGRIVVENWNFPDGCEGDDRSRAFYAPREHAGELVIRDCYLQGFSDNCIYANSPGYDDGAGGRVVVDGCFTHNNNISGIRVGSDGSVVRNCTVFNDEKAPTTSSGSYNQRGIWVRSAGDDVLIENCEVIHTYEDASSPVIFGEDGLDSSGELRNVRIYNDTDAEPCNAPDAWDGRRVHVEGDGETEVPSHVDTCDDGCGHGFEQIHSRADVLSWQR